MINKLFPCTLTGALTESNKANNISSGVEVCMVTADAYEPDGSPALAKSISPGQSQVHNATGPGDQDWVRFTAQAGEEFTIFTSNLGPSADTYLYVYSSDGTTLLSSNDDYGGTLASRIDFTAPSTGTYYILVKQWNPNSGGCGTNYTLTLDFGIRIMLPVVRNH